MVLIRLYKSTIHFFCSEMSDAVLWSVFFQHNVIRILEIEWVLVLANCNCHCKSRSRAFIVYESRVHE